MAHRSTALTSPKNVSEMQKSQISLKSYTILKDLPRDLYAYYSLRGISLDHSASETVTAFENILSLKLNF